MSTLAINPVKPLPTQSVLNQKAAPSMGQQIKAALNNRTVQLAITLTGAAALAALFSPMLSVTHTSNHTQALANKTTDQLNSADRFKGVFEKPITALAAIKTTLPQCLLIKETAVAVYNPLSHLDVTSIDTRQCGVVPEKIELDNAFNPIIQSGTLGLEHPLSLNDSANTPEALIDIAKYTGYMHAAANKVASFLRSFSTSYHQHVCDNYKKAINNTKISIRARNQYKIDARAYGC